MSIKIAQQSLTWIRYPKDFTLDEKLDQIKEAGYEGVELMESLDELGSPKNLCQILAKRGLVLASLSTIIGLDDREKLEEAKRKVEYAAKFGVKALMVCGGFPKKGMNLNESHFEVLGRELEELSLYASEFNMQVAFHPHIGCRVETKEDIDKLFKYTKFTKLCLDTAHLVAKGSDPIQVLDAYKDKIAYIHLKDWKEEKEVNRYWEHFVELGEGDLGIDFSGFLTKLKEIGYEGWVAVELDSTTRTPLESAKISRQYLRRLGY
jgi:inosose dehydratase